MRGGMARESSVDRDAQNRSSSKGPGGGSVWRKDNVLRADGDFAGGNSSADSEGDRSSDGAPVRRRPHYCGTGDGSERTTGRSGGTGCGAGPGEWRRAAERNMPGGKRTKRDRESVWLRTGTRRRRLPLVEERRPRETRIERYDCGWLAGLACAADICGFAEACRRSAGGGRRGDR